MKDYLDASYGLLVYQDDVLLTAIKLGGYSWLEADTLRKAMGKKIPAEMAKQKEKLIKGFRNTASSPEQKPKDLEAHRALRRLRLQQGARRLLRQGRVPDRLHEGELSRSNTWPRCSPRTPATPTFPFRISFHASVLRI
jgi:hypothetical protein